MRKLIAIALLSCAALANAQTVLIRGATVHTVAEQGVLTNADVLIRDGKIAAVGTGLSAPADATSVDAKGRTLTPGLFGGLSGIGIEEVTLEPTTVDSAVLLNAPAFEMQWRPEFDVTAAYNARSVLVPVARIEGLTWTVLAPSSGEGGTFVPGQGAAVTLDGRYDAVLEGSRSLFINLGGNANAMSAGSRAGQWMLLDQAIRETRSPNVQDEHRLLHPAGREALARYLAGGRVVFNVARAAGGSASTLRMGARANLTRQTEWMKGGKRRGMLESAAPLDIVSIAAASDDPTRLSAPTPRFCKPLSARRGRAGRWFAGAGRPSARARAGRRGRAAGGSRGSCPASGGGRACARDNASSRPDTGAGGRAAMACWRRGSERCGATDRAPAGA
jgi:hypothetical protein